MATAGQSTILASSGRDLPALSPHWGALGERLRGAEMHIFPLALVSWYNIKQHLFFFS